MPGGTESRNLRLGPTGQPVFNCEPFARWAGGRSRRVRVPWALPRAERTVAPSGRICDVARAEQDRE